MMSLAERMGIVNTNDYAGLADMYTSVGGRNILRARQRRADGWGGWQVRRC